MVPMLRLQTSDKAEEFEVQGEAQSKGENSGQERSSKIRSSFGRDDNKIKPSTDFAGRNQNKIRSGQRAMIWGDG